MMQETSSINDQSLKKLCDTAVFEFGADFVLYDAQSNSVVLQFKEPEFGIQRTRIALAPGGFLLKAARFVFSKRSFNRVYEPIVADMLAEYFEALAAGEEWRARWIHVRGVLFFSKQRLSQCRLRC